MADPRSSPRSAPSLGEERHSGGEQSQISVSERGLRFDFGILHATMRGKALCCRPVRPRASSLSARKRFGGSLARRMLLLLRCRDPLDLLPSSLQWTQLLRDEIELHPNGTTRRQMPAVLQPCVLRCAKQHSSATNPGNASEKFLHARSPSNFIGVPSL